MQTIPGIVSQLMSKDVLTLTEDQDLSHLDAAMRLLRFRHMPVVDDKRLVGLVTQRDLLGVAASSLLPKAREQTELLEQRFRVRDVMSRNVRTVHPDTPLADAARILYAEKLGCLPVVNAENVLVGIVTEADFVLLASRLLEGRTDFTVLKTSVGN